MEQRGTDLYRALAQALFLAAGIVLALWFLSVIRSILLLFAAAVILYVILNAPVTWMVRKGLSRWLAVVLICLVVAILFGLLGWLVIPQLVTQATLLTQQLPHYLHLLTQRSSRWLARYPIVQGWLQTTSNAAPSGSALLTRVANYSLWFFDLLAAVVVLLSTVVYMLLQPRPLLRGYLAVMPPSLCLPAERAFARGAELVVAWIGAQLLIGTIEGVAAAIALSLIGVPGALVWAAFTCFAELIPRLGPYLMAIPPLLAALAVQPMMALWVFLFYLALNETMGDIVLPYIWGTNMRLHPVSLIFAITALWAAFGPLGALISVPISGFIKAFYEEFYLARNPPDAFVDQGVECLLEHKAMDRSP